MGFHKGLIGKTDGGASVKNLQNSGQATALMKQDVTLKDYIERKTDNRGELGISKSVEKRLAAQTKLTFDEWYSQNPSPRFWTTGEYEDYLRCVWNAAQENV